MVVVVVAEVVGWGLSDVTTEYTKEKEKKDPRRVSGPIRRRCEVVK
jgi:hypothetical protein